jgi:hypothetical protein
MKRKAEADRQNNRVIFVLSDQLLADLEAFRESVAQGLGCEDYTRSQAIRSLIRAGLAAMRGQEIPKPEVKHG